MLTSAARLNLQDLGLLSPGWPDWAADTLVCLISLCCAVLVAGLCRRQRSGGVTLSKPDRQILWALHEATGGASWKDGTGWRSGRPLADWKGIETKDPLCPEKVTTLDLGENNLRGAYYMSQWLTFLEQ